MNPTAIPENPSVPPTPLRRPLKQKPNIRRNIKHRPAGIDRQHTRQPMPAGRCLMFRRMLGFCLRGRRSGVGGTLGFSGMAVGFNA
ncbi:MAG: hypothetical protein AAFU85_31980, partial [Planctomycetota bacterium]